MSEPYQPPPQPAPKKGLGPLGWILIGCGGIIVIGAILFAAAGYFVTKKVGEFKDNPLAAAELIIRANPDFEVVSSDKKAQTLTVKNVKTGEVMTLNAADIKDGKFSVTTKDGTATFGANQENGAGVTVTDNKGQVSTFGATGNAPQNLPSWVPVYPGGTTQGTMENNGPEGRSAAFTVTTTDDTAKVLAWYESELQSKGLTVEKNTYSANGATGGIVTGKNADGKQQVNVMIGAADNGGSSAVVSFEEKK